MATATTNKEETREASSIFPTAPAADPFGYSVEARNKNKAARFNDREFAIVNEYLKQNKTDFSALVRHLFKLILVQKAEIFTAEQASEYRRLKAEKEAS